MALPTSPQPAPEVAVTLRAIREGAGLTLTELARRVSVSKSTISRFENGERFVSDDLRHRILREIADAQLESRAS